MASTPAPASPRWVNRPDGSTWGDFGPDDQLGRLNLIDANKVRQGVAEVREGKTFCLSLPLDLPGGNVLNPRRHPPRLRPTQQEGVPRWMFEVGRIETDATDVIKPARHVNELFGNASIHHSNTASRRMSSSRPGVRLA